MSLMLLSRQVMFTETVAETRSIFAAYRAILRLVDNLVLLVGNERSLSLTSTYMRDAHPIAVDDSLQRGFPPKFSYDETTMESGHKVNRESISGGGSGAFGSSLGAGGTLSRTQGAFIVRSRLVGESSRYGAAPDAAATAYRRGAEIEISSKATGLPLGGALQLYTADPLRTPDGEGGGEGGQEQDDEEEERGEQEVR